MTEGVYQLCMIAAIIFFWPVELKSQVSYLDLNSIKSGFTTGGVLFSAADTAAYSDTLSSLLKIERDSAIATVLSSGFWATGLDAGGNLKGAASTIYRNKDWATGPVSASYDSAYDSLYDAVFKITASDIAYHVAHYTDVGYQMPASIKRWPGNGRDSLRELHNLAPYVDVNHNNVYDPQNGDYPNICGDEAIFFMLNDIRNPHTEFVGQGMKVQLNVLAFDVQDTMTGTDTAAVNSSFFLKLSLINCSTVSYNKVLFSIFNDYRIGCYENDRAGCDTTLNAIYSYNGSYPDSGCQSYNTGLNKAAQGVVFLNQQLYSHAVFSAFADTITPWPVQWQLPLGNPRNFQSGYWADGTPFTIGGDGYGGTIPIHYLFPGNPLNPNDWSDETSGTFPGNRTGIGTVFLDSLSPGASKNIDLAFVSSYVPSTDTANEILLLKQHINSIQGFYATLLSCGTEPTSINALTEEQNQIRIFPNPTEHVQTIVIDNKNNEQALTVDLFDVQGRIIKHCFTGNLKNGSNEFIVNLNDLPSGIYLYKFQTDKSATSKIVCKL